MEYLLDKINRIRTAGQATLKLCRNSPFFIYNGNKFRVYRLGKPGRKCRVVLIVKYKKVNLSIHDIR